MAYNKYSHKKESQELKTLQEIRENAKTPEDWQKAQDAIDVFFLGEPKKKKERKKKKKSYIPIDEDEWDDWD